MPRRKRTESPFPRIFQSILTNADTEERWHWHDVVETSTSTLLPSFYYDDESLTVCLPLEYRVMKNHQIRSCMTTLVKMAYGEPHNLKKSRTLMRFIMSPECLAERRKIVMSEIGIRTKRRVPREFNDAMALHPGLRKCLDGMAIAFYERGGNIDITRSDYLSKTILIADEVFDDGDRLLKTYIAFRELASCLCVHPMGEYGMMPNPDMLRKFMNRFPNWRAYEKKCIERGWRFRYGEIT